MNRLLFLLLTFTGGVALAQTDAPPVTLAVQTLPPFTPNLSSWSDVLNDKVGLTLLLNDRAQAGYQVGLRMTIEGQGVRLQTSLDWQPTPIALSYGVPVRISSIDLLEYFDLDHLIFSGISRQQYLDQGGLPEGSYAVCFEAYDLLRAGEGPASLRACSFLQARLLDPPVVLSPSGVQIPLNPQLLLVQWQARHTATFLTAYTVEIYARDSVLTPEQTYSLQQPFLTATVDGLNSLLIDASYPQLEVGGNYFVRVRASDPGGTTAFKNSGYSPLAFFAYGSDCMPPVGLAVDVQGHDRAGVSWNYQPGSASYVMRYRERNDSAHWFEAEAIMNRFQLDNLEDSVFYEVQLQSVCGTVPGEFGPVFEFMTPPRPFDPESFDCGADIVDLEPPASHEPIATMTYGTRIQVGRFEMKITGAEQHEEGTWEGFGQIYVPWMGQRLNCTFDSLGVNEEGFVFAGEVVAVDEGLDSLDDFLTLEDVLAGMDTATIDFCGERVPLKRAEEEEEVEEPEPVYTETPNYENLIRGAGGTTLPFVQGSGTERLALYNMVFTATGATIDAFSSAQLPFGGPYVAFGADTVGVQPYGLQGGSTLSLLNSVTFDYGGKAKFSLDSFGNNYLSFDCSGITEVGMQATVEFCRDYLVPVDTGSGEVLDVGYVTGTFQATAASWKKLTGELSLSPFELPKLPGWVFFVDAAVVDMSDAVTPEVVVFPEDYTHADVDPDLPPGENPAWKGFYLTEARLRLPPAFTGGARDSSQALTIGAAQLLIDKTGFTGSISAEYPVPLKEGRAGTWAMSLDTVAISLAHNQFKSTYLGGQLAVPAFDEPLAYSGYVEPGAGYALALELQDTASMSAMAANFELYENTAIGLEYDAEEDAFVADIQLHGRASFSPVINQKRRTTQGSKASQPGDGDRLELAAIDFEGFHLSTQKPYIVNLGNWALSANTDNDQPLMAGFPLQLREVSMIHDTLEKEVAFGLGMTLNLLSDKNMGFGADGRAFIVCKVTVDSVQNTQRWVFDRVRVDKLSVEYRGPAYEMSGFIENFEADDTYGSGYAGGLLAGFTPGISVGATALFGKKNGHRYFFMDALASLDPGIPIAATGMAFYGFGGGVSYGMRRKGFAGIQLPLSEATDTGADATGDNQGGDAGAGVTNGATGSGPPPTLAEALATEDPAAAYPSPVALPDEIGNSLSGLTYVPDTLAGLGLKAMIAYGTLKRQVFNGDLAFEVIFNRSGGLGSIGLMGNANFLTPPPTPANPEPVASIGAYVGMGYDFEAAAFSANLRMKVYVKDGLITGAYPDYVAGEGAIYADNSQWYIYLGTPDKPIRLNYDVNALGNVAGAGETAAVPGGAERGLPPESIDQPLGEIGDVGLLLTSYLDAGSVLPAFPDPPEAVLELLQRNESGFNPTSRDDPSFANASGLLFGAGFGVTMPDLRFLAFYAYLNAGMGYDLMLKNYGTSAVCANLSPGPSPIGMNGWYATGQYYGYLEAGVGIKVDLFGFSGRYPIFDVGAAALLQARLPNPLWMKGEIAGQYDILGGLVSGRCQFEFEAGDKCDLSPAAELENIAVLESLVPAAGTYEVDVFTQPQALFNFSIDRVIVLQDEQGNYVNLKPVLRKFTVTDDDRETNIPGELVWNSERTVVAFRPTDILPGQSAVTLSVTVDVLRLDDGNWVPLEVDGEFVVDAATATFLTGTAPDHVVESNIRYAYPINRQLNFLRDEAGNGYIQLDRGQDDLFLGQPGCSLDPNEWTQGIRFTSGNQDLPLAAIVYNGAENRLSFAIPGQSFGPDEMVSYEIVNVPKGNGGDVDANVTEVTRDLAQNLPPGADAANASSVLLRSREASGTLTSGEETQLYHLDFKTSRYGTFSEKAAALVASLQYNFVSPQALTTPPDRILSDDGSSFAGPYLSIDNFGQALKPAEGLDLYDLEGDQVGNKQIDRLVRAEATLSGTPEDWYLEHPGTQLYDRFPRSSPALQLAWREAGVLGEPPVRAVRLRKSGNYVPGKLSDYAIASGHVPAFPTEVQVGYDLPYVMYRDFIDYYNQVGNYLTVATDLPDDLADFYQWQFVYPKYGQYAVRLEYYLPGQDTPQATFSTEISYDVSVFKK